MVTKVIIRDCPPELLTSAARVAAETLNQEQEITIWQGEGHIFGAIKRKSGTITIYYQKDLTEKAA